MPRRGGKKHNGTTLTAHTLGPSVTLSGIRQYPNGRLMSKPSLLNKRLTEKKNYARRTTELVSHPPPPSVHAPYPGRTPGGRDRRSNMTPRVSKTPQSAMRSRNSKIVGTVPFRAVRLANRTETGITREARISYDVCC